MDWAERAARRLWDQSEEIDSEAGRIGQMHQNAVAEHEHWVGLVAGVLREELATCPVCRGIGRFKAGSRYVDCDRCHGTGKIG